MRARRGAALVASVWGRRAFVGGGATDRVLSPQCGIHALFVIVGCFDLRETGGETRMGRVRDGERRGQSACVSVSGFWREQGWVAETESSLFTGGGHRRLTRA